MAAPHVTGTVALLQQYAAQNFISNANAKRHEVMKSVLMNSADKIKGIMGMEKTVLHQNGTTNWFTSLDHSNTIPLDLEMGTGALDAKRALQQFNPGEFAPGSVPLVGWDYGGVFDPDIPQKYVLNQPLSQNSYISATLTWDRQVVLDLDTPPFDEYNPGDIFADNGFFNVDLFLVLAGATNTNNAVLKSISTAFNVEHIFGKVPSTGSYELWVVLNDQSLFASTSFGLAWWAEGTVTSASRGDFDGNLVVDNTDYLVWLGAFGTNNPAADANGNGFVDAADYVVWRENLGLQYGSGSALAIAVPEPAAEIIAIFGLVFGFNKRRMMRKVR